jgi:hypothetical protein
MNTRRFGGPAASEPWALNPDSREPSAAEALIVELDLECGVRFFRASRKFACNRLETRLRTQEGLAKGVLGMRFGLAPLAPAAQLQTWSWSR